MPFILGIKKEMTGRFKEGNIIPITVFEAKPCTITQLKTDDKDGYCAVQIGCMPSTKLRDAKKASKFRYRKEFRIAKDAMNQFKVGQTIDLGVFKKGEMVGVTGFAKGRGFSGVVKRHHFHGHPPGHGHKDSARAPGSIGQAGVQHVFKGMRMAGRMGGGRVTIKNLEIYDIDEEKNLLSLKGGAPGARNSLVLIYN